MLSIEDYKAIFEASPDGCLVVSERGEIRGANPRIGALFGWEPEELVGRDVELLIPRAARAVHVKHRAGFVRDPHNRPMGVGLALEGQRRDGSTFPVEVSLSPWRREEGGLRVVCTVRDVTAYRRLRNFSEGALRASEDERKRIARELHDDTAQRLATLILRVRALAAQADDAERERLFEEVRTEIVEAADGVKRISRGLRPPEIEEVGLSLALQAHVRRFRVASGLTVGSELGHVDPYLDVTARLALYRIVQEALSNVRRHARADRVSVRLAREGDQVVAEVRDDGCGFAPEDEYERQEGLGLIGMQERAAMMGGRLLIDSAPGRGTLIRLTVPALVEGEPHA